MMDRAEKTQETSIDRFGRLGTFFLGGGLLLILARALENSHGFPKMPRFWYQNDSVWWLIGLTSIGVGSWMLGKSEQSGDSKSRWKPTVGGKRFRELILYTRDGCHLCDEAEELITAYLRWLPPITPVNIDSDPKLVEHYGKCVPVVAIDGKVRFRGRINEVLLRRLIEGAAPDGAPSPMERNLTEDQ